MKKIRDMNSKIFHANLVLSINEVLKTSDFNENDVRIVIVPILEEGKPLNSVDDVMRLVFLNEDKIKDKMFTVSQAVGLLTCYEPLVPIWIDVSCIQKDEEKIVIKLETSLRMRKPSLLRNADSGHPPFRTIID